MIEYVATMLYEKRSNLFVGVLKEKGPEVVLGKWNYIGGKVEGAESLLTTHVREFKEETGLDLLEIADKKGDFTITYGDYAKVNFARFDLYPRIDGAELKLPPRNDVGERLSWVDPSSSQLVPNLYWITPALLGGIASGELVGDDGKNAKEFSAEEILAQLALLEFVVISETEIECNQGYWLYPTEAHGCQVVMINDCSTEIDEELCDTVDEAKLWCARKELTREI